MEMKIVDGREVPVLRAHLDAILELKYMQRNYIHDLDLIDDVGVEYMQRNYINDLDLFDDVDSIDDVDVENAQEKIRDKAEKCGIDLPESCDAFHWLISQEGIYRVMQSFKEALGDSKPAPTIVAAPVVVPVDPQKEIDQETVQPKGRKRTWFGLALAELKKDRSLTDAEIARRVEVDKSTLSRNMEWQTIRLTLQQQDLDSIPRGTKYDGCVDAIDD